MASQKWIVFSVWGKLTGHFPVCGWLHVATAFVKQMTTGWDDKVQNPLLAQMIGDIFTRVTQDNLMKGDWCISGQEVTVWVDTSSLATGLVVESNGVVAEDATWLWLVYEYKHINLAELDAVLRGWYRALQWNAKVIHLQTDSVCVHRWVADTFSGQTRVHTKAATEILIRHWLTMLWELAFEYKLEIDVGLVKSHENRADQLTRVPQRWLNEIRTMTEPIEPVCAIAEKRDIAWIQAIRWSSEHPGVKRTLYFVRLINPRATKAEVWAVLMDCRECQSIDSAPVQWKLGRLDVAENWNRVAMDLTHFRTAAIPIRVCFPWRLNRVCLVRLFAGRCCLVGVRFRWCSNRFQFHR